MLILAFNQGLGTKFAKTDIPQATDLIYLLYERIAA